MNNHFIKIESIIETLKIDIEKRYNISTKHLTYTQLLETEQNSIRKELLQKILSLLQLREYGNVEINIDELTRLVKMFLSENIF